jgi:SAM-dependent methyltransferase
MKSDRILSPESFYDRMAPFYDCHIEKTRFPSLSPIEEREFLESFLSNCGIILDLGCGTGRTMKLLRSKDRILIGADISSEMIKVAKAGGLHVVNASCYNLPFGNCHFDAIYSIHMGFGFCRGKFEMEILSKELFRVLKEKGIILLDTPHARAKGREYVTSWIAGGKLINAMSYGKTKEGVSEVLTGSGFVDISFYGFYKVDCRLEEHSRRLIVVAKKP